MHSSYSTPLSGWYWLMISHEQCTLFERRQGFRSHALPCCHQSSSSLILAHYYTVLCCPCPGQQVSVTFANFSSMSPVQMYVKSTEVLTGTWHIVQPNVVYLACQLKQAVHSPFCTANYGQLGCLVAAQHCCTSYSSPLTVVTHQQYNA